MRDFVTYLVVRCDKCRESAIIFILQGHSYEPKTIAVHLSKLAWEVAHDDICPICLGVKGISSGYTIDLSKGPLMPSDAVSGFVHQMADPTDIVNVAKFNTASVVKQQPTFYVPLDSDKCDGCSQLHMTSCVFFDRNIDKERARLSVCKRAQVLFSGK
jgi:hypothetical protein